VLRSKNLTIRGSGPGAWTLREVGDMVGDLLDLVKDLPGQPMKVVKLRDVEAVWEQPGSGRLVVVT